MVSAAARAASAAAGQLAILVGLAAGCGDGGAERATGTATIDVGGEAVPVDRLRDAATALCTARDEARADVNRARATFYDRSHDDLHIISRALEPVDRSQAARLLEDKQRVEADLEGGAPPDDLASDLDRLAGVTRSGLAALSITVSPCRQG